MSPTLTRSATPLPLADQDAEANPCHALLSMMASMGSHHQKNIHSLWAQRAVETPCLSLADWPAEARALVQSALRQAPPRERQCHDNAWRLAALDERFTIRSGWALSIIPLEHSWVSLDWEGRQLHFDPTDLGVFSGKAFSRHLSVASLDSREARSWALALGHTGPFLFEMAAVELGLRTFADFERSAARRSAVPTPPRAPGRSLKGPR